MSIALNQEQTEMAQVVRRFLSRESPEREVRRLMETDDGYDVAVWKRMAKDLSLQGVAIPAEYGGVGYSIVELGMVFEEMGRALLCAPFFSTVAMAVPALLLSGDEAAMSDVLPPIAEGQLTATLAWTDVPTPPPSVTPVRTRAERIDGKWVLEGHEPFVVDGASADLILVVAETDAGTTLFSVDRRSPGVECRPLRGLDMTRKVANVSFSGAAARPIGVMGEGRRIADGAVEIATVALAAEQVGGAQRALDMAVTYATDRVQFGRPIGAFQAVKHKCADMLVDVECARSAAYDALSAVGTDRPDRSMAASVAAAFCGEAFLRTAEDNIQIHGGLGFTWDHPAHLYFRRAKASQMLLGTPAQHRRLLATALSVSMR